jgi:hypothetical protein
MAEVFDGVGPHASSLKAMQMRADIEILCIKEEVDFCIVTKCTKNTLQHKTRLQRNKALLCYGQLLFIKRGYCINGD